MSNTLQLANYQITNFMIDLTNYTEDWLNITQLAAISNTVVILNGATNSNLVLYCNNYMHALHNS